MNQIHAIIFDMDGVIVDSEHLHLEVEKTILTQRGIEAPWSEWNKFTGLPDHTIFQYIVDNFTDGAHSVEQLIKAKYEIFPSILCQKLQPIPGALDFIRWAKRQCYKLALTTSSTQKIQQTIFTLFELAPYFDVVVTGDQIRHSKPHPEPYLKTVQTLNLAVEHCLVLEDSLNGIKSAKEAGCYVVGITSSFPKNLLLDAGADIIVDKFSALYDHLRIKNEQYVNS